MAEHSNFLIGYGERLASDMAAPVAGAPRSIHTHLWRLASASRRKSRRLRRKPGRRARDPTSYVSRQVLLPGGIA